MTNISVPTKKNFSGIRLSPAEMAKLAELKKPDAPTQSKMTFTPEIEQQILACLCQLPDVMEHAIRVLEPGHFVNGTREAIYKVVAAYYRQHKACPSKEVLLQYLTDCISDAGKLMCATAEVKTLWQDHEPELHHKTELIAMLERFIQFQAVKSVTLKVSIAAADDHDINKAWEILEGAKRPKLSASQGIVNNWSSIMGIAETQKEDWLVPNWLEFGAMTLFSGLPKKGKSTIVAELIASIATGKQWYGQQVTQCPMLLADPENRERTLVKRLTACLGHDHGKMDGLFHRINEGARPKPCTASYLATAIKEVQRLTGLGKGILILDTLRSLFSDENYNENESGSMTKILVPLKTLATETGWAVLLLHHNNKGSDQYSGSTAIAGVPDHLWNLRTTEKQLLRSKLVCEGRGDFVKPLLLQFLPETGRNKVIIDNPAPTADDLTLIPDSKEAAVDIEQLVELWDCSDRTAKRRIADFNDKGLLSVIKPANRQDGKYRYYRQQLLTEPADA